MRKVIPSELCKKFKFDYTKWKKLWNMKVTVIQIVTGALGAVTKGLIQGLEDLEISGRGETTQTTKFLRSASILRRVLKDLRRLTVTLTPVKNHQLMWKTLKREIIIITQTTCLGDRIGRCSFNSEHGRPFSILWMLAVLISCIQTTN